MKKAIISLLLGMSAATTFAASAWVDSSAEKILVHDNGSDNYAGLVNVYMGSDMDQVSECVSQPAYKSHFAIDLSRPGAEAQYSLLLAAHIAGKKMTIDINTNKCAEGIPLVRNIFVAQ